jgi:hypothetical protein
MAAPTESSVIKAQNTKRPSPPHPNNSGAGALRAGIDKLVEHRAEKETAPTRPQGA